jgi:murein DD-endopeptidase MepM/ murein hydrolase activator NlpD
MLTRYKNVLQYFFPFLSKEFTLFILFFFEYLKKKIIKASQIFENYKNLLVKFLLLKRGRYNRPFLHFATMGVLAFGVLIAPFVADTYPVFSAGNPNQPQIVEDQSIEVGDDVFATQVSQKVRSEVITYTVEKGDTLSTIAKKFDISVDTIKWANDLTGDIVTTGDTLKILPVTGILHKVTKGDSVKSIADKYNTNAQKIVDFPFNDFANPETFSLIAGQMLIVPDGTITAPSAPKPSQNVYIATAPVGKVSSGGFTWPIHGGISQFASWYHMALDITDPFGTPIYAAQDATVTKVSVGTYDGGYGNNVWIDNGSGFASHYCHMRDVNVSVGQQVYAGKTIIGWIGLTGRTTGAHLHFEIRKDGVLVNPLTYLP